MSTGSFAAFASAAHPWAGHCSHISAGGSDDYKTPTFPSLQNQKVVASFASPPFPLCSWWSASPRTLFPFLSSHAIPIPLLGAQHCLFHRDRGDLGPLFSSLLLLGLCQCLSSCPSSCIAPEIDYPARERTISWRKGLSSLEHSRRFSSSI